MKIETFKYIGVVFKNCDPTGAQKSALHQDQAFSQQLSSSYATEFGHAEGIFNDLKTNLQSITDKGINQEGFSPEEKAARNSQILNNAAAGNKKVQQSIGEHAAMTGAVPGVESGVTAATRAQAAAQIDNNASNQEAEVTKENFDTGRKNFEFASDAEANLPKVFSTANNAAGDVNQADKITDDQTNENAKQQSSWMGLVGGLANSAVGGLTARYGKK